MAGMPDTLTLTVADVVSLFERVQQDTYAVYVLAPGGFAGIPYCVVCRQCYTCSVGGALSGAHPSPDNEAEAQEHQWSERGSVW